MVNEEAWEGHLATISKTGMKKDQAFSVYKDQILLTSHFEADRATSLALVGKSDPAEEEGKEINCTANR